ncbi:hypothetical protein, partial [Vibrio parahaemolyticus]
KFHWPSNLFQSNCYVAAFFLLTPMFVSAQSTFRLGFFSPVDQALSNTLQKQKASQVGGFELQIS